MNQGAGIKEMRKQNDLEEGGDGAAFASVEGAAGAVEVTVDAGAAAIAAVTGTTRGGA